MSNVCLFQAACINTETAQRIAPIPSTIKSDSANFPKTHIQDMDCLERFVALYEAAISAGEDPWMDAALQATLAEHWSKHMTFEGLKCAAQMAGRGTLIDQCATKAALAKAMCDAHVRPIPVQCIRAWLLGVEPPAQDAPLAPEDPAADGEPPVIPDPAPEANGAPGAASMPLMAMSASQLQLILAAVAGSTGAGKATTDGLTPSGAGAPLSAYEALIALAVKCIIEGKFFDCLRLGRANLDVIKMKGASRGESQRISLGSGMFLTGGGPTLPSVSHVYDPEAFAQGFMRWVGMHAASKCDLARARVPDLLAWGLHVSEMKAGTSTMKVKFAKEFMFKYQGKSDWLGLVKQDYSLMMDHLHSEPSQPPQSRGKGAGPQRTQRPPTTPSPLKRKGPGGGGRPVQSVSPGSRPSRVRICYSRKFENAAECTRIPNCKFDHRCASCQGDHCGADCKMWDDSKARAYLASL